MKIGIDIGGSHIATGIVDYGGKILAKETLDINLSDISSTKAAEEFLVNTINLQIEKLLKKTNYQVDDITKIGIAAPGNPTESEIKNLVNLHIKNFNIKEKLEKIYNTKIKIKNDGKCAGIAEKEYGALRPYKDAVFLCIGTGVGSAVFLNNELLEPRRASGFELGHIIIEKDNGIKCNCGNKGCFETYVSMKRFKKNAIEKLKLPQGIKSEEVQQYIRTNIEKLEVKSFINTYVENLSVGISNIINIFEPEAICFGGSFSYYDDIFLPILEEKIKKYQFNKDDDVRFVLSKLKNDAGIIGATEI